MTNWIGWLFSGDHFMPHGHCFLWQPGTLWLNVGSDALIAGSYFAIPLTIYSFTRQKRTEIRFAWVPTTFAAFILLCGGTHVMEIWTVWDPLYRAAGALKLVTGLVSFATLLSLLWIMPRAMLLKTPLQLEAEVRARTRELVAANEQLRSEIAARDTAEQRSRLLVDELNHRVKNTLATVQAIAVRTLGRETPDRFDAFQSRLRALAVAHDVLTRERWSGADLYELAAGQLEPVAGTIGGRIRLSGPSLRLSAKASVALAMGFHELAINAVKYGALSNDVGEVLIHWEVTRTTQSPQLRLTWTEQHGPEVPSPTGTGFGTQLIERILARDLRGAVRLDFTAPSGVRCTIETPLSNVMAPAQFPPYPRLETA